MGLNPVDMLEDVFYLCMHGCNYTHLELYLHEQTQIIANAVSRVGSQQFFSYRDSSITGFYSKLLTMYLHAAMNLEVEFNLKRYSYYEYLLAIPLPLITFLVACFMLIWKYMYVTKCREMSGKCSRFVLQLCMFTFGAT